MTAEERLEEMESWLAREYEAAYAIFRATSWWWEYGANPTTGAQYYVKLDTLSAVARHLITGQDGPVSVLNERFIIFTRHYRSQETPVMNSEYGKNPDMRPIEGTVAHPAYCTGCKQTTPHHHVHDTAHGIPETHMSGTERYECTYCKTSIHKDDRGVLNAHLRFILD